MASKHRKLAKGTVVMSPQEFADLRGVSLQAVCSALRREESYTELRSKTLKGVTKFEKHSRFYLLHVNTIATLS